jgi:hypothetical protein
MDFWRTVTVLFRRWYLTVPALLATLGITAAAHSMAPNRYESSSVLVLTAPLHGGTEAIHSSRPGEVINPLTNFDQSLALTGAIVIQQLNSSETANALGATPGGATNYSVNNGTSNPELLQSGPFVFIEGVGPSPEVAQGLTEKLAALAKRILAQRQTDLDAPPSTHITMQTVVPPTAGQPLTGSPMRAAAATGALAGLASLAAVYGFESFATHRRRRRQMQEGGLDLGESDSAPTGVARSIPISDTVPTARATLAHAGRSVSDA